MLKLPHGDMIYSPVFHCEKEKENQKSRKKKQNPQIMKTLIFLNCPFFFPGDTEKTRRISKEVKSAGQEGTFN